MERMTTDDELVEDVEKKLRGRPEFISVEIYSASSGRLLQRRTMSSKEGTGIFMNFEPECLRGFRLKTSHPVDVEISYGELGEQYTSVLFGHTMDMEVSADKSVWKLNIMVVV